MKLLVWNMGGAFCYDRFTHERAWEFLREQDPDVALLQEARPPDWAREHWGSFPFASVGPGVAWGSAILSRIRGLHEHQPDQSTPWLRELWGPVVVARLGSDPGLWLASIHSSWRALSPEQLSRCSIEGIRRCREDKIWAVEVIASELERPFAGSPFVFGGDLNSARSFDGRPGFGGNVRLHENLAAGGFHDLRLVSYRDEQQTYFKAGKGPDQLDHVFADERTKDNARSWRVVLDPIKMEPPLSDHAPIEVVLGPNGQGPVRGRPRAEAYARLPRPRPQRPRPARGRRVRPGDRLLGERTSAAASCPLIAPARA